MGKSGCFPPGGCRWIVEFKKSMHVRVAKFRNDFRRKVFRDNKHLGNLGADKLHNETGTRDMEITKKSTKPAKEKVAKNLTFDYQPALYAEEASSENHRIQVVNNSNVENTRNSSPKRHDSSQKKDKAVVNDPVPTRSMNEELDAFVNVVIRNSVEFLIRESNSTYLIKESTENLLKKHESNVDTTDGHVVRDTDTTNKSNAVNIIKASTENLQAERDMKLLFRMRRSVFGMDIQLLMLFLYLCQLFTII